MYRNRVWIVLVPGKSSSAMRSRMTPMPSSSRVSRSRNSDRIRFIRSRSVASWSSQVSVAANGSSPIHLAFDFPLPSGFVAELPKIHVHELHERIVRAVVVTYDSLLSTKFRQIRKREVQELRDEFCVQIRITQPCIPEPGNEKLIAGREASERAEKDFRHEGFRRFAKPAVRLGY